MFSLTGSSYAIAKVTGGFFLLLSSREYPRLTLANTAVSSLFSSVYPSHSGNFPNRSESASILHPPSLRDRRGFIQSDNVPNTR